MICSMLWTLEVFDLQTEYVEYSGPLGDLKLLRLLPD